MHMYAFKQSIECNKCLKEIQKASEEGSLQSPLFIDINGIKIEICVFNMLG